MFFRHSAENTRNKKEYITNSQLTGTHAWCGPYGARLRLLHCDAGRGFSPRVQHAATWRSSRAGARKLQN